MSSDIPEFIKKQFFEFRKIYRNWFKELSDSFPDNKKEIIKFYKDHMNDDPQQILKRFFTNIDDYLVILCDCNNDFFDKSVHFYREITYHSLMNSEAGLSESFRKSQLTYLTKLSYMAIMLFDFTNKDNTDNEETRAKMEKYSPLLIKLLTNIQSLDGTNMDNLINNFESAFKSGNLENVEKTFMEDNPILCDLADEISKEIKIPETFKNLQNPQDIFKVMFDKEGKEFMEEMVKTVGSKIQSKIQSGKINEKDLINQAQKMMGTVFKNNPLFGAGAAGGPSVNPEEEREKTRKKEELRRKLRENIKNKKH
jgi:ribosomal protein L12E/L44/L45/RPP1/RPP2